MELETYKEPKLKVEIETLLIDGWKTCEHKSWTELLEDGWVLQSVKKDGLVLMSRRGYLNEFREVKILEE